MRHVAAYALLVPGGNASPSAADVEKVLKEAGATHEAANVASLCAAMEGKSFNEICAAGLKKIGSSGPAGAAATGGAAKAAAVVEEEEPEPEEDVDMGGLFGGGDDEDY